MKESYQNLADMYARNEDFKEYVDKYSKCRHITVEEALQHAIVDEKAKDIINRM